MAMAAGTMGTTAGASASPRNRRGPKSSVRSVYGVRTTTASTIVGMSVPIATPMMPNAGASAIDSTRLAMPDAIEIGPEPAVVGDPLEDEPGGPQAEVDDGGDGQDPDDRCPVLVARAHPDIEDGPCQQHQADGQRHRQPERDAHATEVQRAEARTFGRGVQL